MTSLPATLSSLVWVKLWSISEHIHQDKQKDTYDICTEAQREREKVVANLRKKEEKCRMPSRPSKSKKMPESEGWLSQHPKTSLSQGKPPPTRPGAPPPQVFSWGKGPFERGKYPTPILDCRVAAVETSEVGWERLFEGEKKKRGRGEKVFLLECGVAGVAEGWWVALDLVGEKDERVVFSLRV